MLHHHIWLISMFATMTIMGFIQVVFTKHENRRDSAAGYCIASFFALLAVIVHAIWGPK